MNIQRITLVLAVLLGLGLATAGCDKSKNTEETDLPAKKPEKATAEPKAEGIQLKLDKGEYASGDTIAVNFGAALPAAGEQYWLTLVKDGAPDGEWGKWHMVKAGADSDELKTSEGGSFEVRLHDGYPKKSHNIVARQKVTVGGEASLLSLEKTSFSVGDTIAVKFSKALPPEEGKYWLTLVKEGSADSEWGKWHMVADGATEDKLDAVEKGSFEVRLHSSYPTKKHNMVATQQVTIQ